MARRLRVHLLAVFVLAIVLVWGLTYRAFSRSIGSLDLVFGNAMPSALHLSEMIEHLGIMGREMRRFNADPTDQAVRSETATHMRSEREYVRNQALRYLDFPAFPHEPPLQDRMKAALDALDAAIDATLATKSADEERRANAEQFLPALDAAQQTVTDLIQFNAQEGSNTSRAVFEAHQSARYWSLAFAGSALAVVVSFWFVAHSAEKRAESLREQRLAELDAFAARVAHDLKGPLTAIPTGTALLRLEPELSERARGSLARMDASAKRMAALIDGLLAFARSGAAPAANVTGSVDDVVRTLNTLIQPLLDAEQARLVCDVVPRLQVRASEGVLASIIQNLVRNAVVYLGESEKREVTLRVRPDDAAPMVLIEVEDTGPGIPLDVQKRLFRPFERGTTTVAGHGLGLATVKRLAESHGGSVELESEVGTGSRFRVRLPRV